MGSCREPKSFDSGRLTDTEAVPFLVLIKTGGNLCEDLLRLTHPSHPVKRQAKKLEGNKISRNARQDAARNYFSLDQIARLNKHRQ